MRRGALPPALDAVVARYLIHSGTEAQLSAFGNTVRRRN